MINTSVKPLKLYRKYDILALQGRQTVESAAAQVGVEVEQANEEAEEDAYIRAVNSTLT